LAVNLVSAIVESKIKSAYPFVLNKKGALRYKKPGSVAQCRLRIFAMLNMCK